MSGSTSLVSLLDPLPEDVLALDGDGCTPLHHAAASRKYDVVKFLALRANGRVGGITRASVGGVLRSKRGSGGSGVAGERAQSLCALHV